MSLLVSLLAYIKKSLTINSVVCTNDSENTSALLIVGIILMRNVIQRHISPNIFNK